jgi:hypothetical protein
MTIIILGVLSAIYVIFGYVDLAMWWFPRGILGFFEYPEKLLLAWCIAAYAMLVGSNSSFQPLIVRLRRPVRWLALSVGIFAFASKGILFFMAEDGDIAQWHLLCIWMGALLAIGATSQK